MVNPIIEVCANSVQSCIEAQKGGAYRVELCAGIPEGGTTPSIGQVVIARRETTLKINVIIRPRAGDFCYSDMEIEEMIHDIQVVKAAGADGVVFGCLLPDGSVDMERNRWLVEAADGISTTFHRAFDVCADPRLALEQIIELGFDRVLTSGCEPTAMQGVLMLKNLVEQARGRIVVMPGCGVNEDNIAELASRTLATEFHSSARHRLPSAMRYRNERVSMGGTVVVDEYSIDVTSCERVSKMVEALRNV